MILQGGINYMENDAFDIEKNLEEDTTLEIEETEPVDMATEDINKTNANEFAQKVEELSLDELMTERERLIDIGAIEETNNKDDAMSIIEGLSADQLRQIREKIVSGDQEVLNILGLSENTDDTDDTPHNLKKVLKKTR